jgi:hypothetical protein
MSTRAVTPAVAAAVSVLTPVPRPMLQRICACGRHTGGGECDDCKKKQKVSSQRHGDGSTGSSIAPPIVHEAFRSPSQLASGIRFSESRDGHDFSQLKPTSSIVDPLDFPGKVPRFRKEIPLRLGLDLHDGQNSSMLDATVANLPLGRSLSRPLRNRIPSVPRSVLNQVQVHDDPKSRVTSDLLNSEGIAYKKHIVLGNKARDSNWVTAHELAHVLQQDRVTLPEGATEPRILERQADQFADKVTRPTPASPMGGLALSHASPGLAQKVIWKHIQELPGDLLLILDVDDGDFVGGCVKAIVPHVGVKLIKKFPHLELFNLHVGFLTNPAGEFCIFFYESVTGICEVLCFPSKAKLREKWEEVKAWLKRMIEKLIKALAIALLLAALAILAYLIAEAIVAALLLLLAAAAA